MSVSPRGLKGVTADRGEPRQLKCLRVECFFRVPVNIPHNVGLAFAAGARAMPAEFFEGNKRFLAVIPFNGQFAANVLNVQWVHLFLGGLLKKRFFGSGWGTFH